MQSWAGKQNIALAVYLDWCILFWALSEVVEVVLPGEIQSAAQPHAYMQVLKVPHAADRAPVAGYHGSQAQRSAVMQNHSVSQTLVLGGVGMLL